MPEADENIIKRIMPHDPETERSLLGAMIMDQEKIPVACEYVTEKDFYDPQFGLTFSAIVSLYNSKQVVDPVTLRNKLESMGLPKEVATLEFVSVLINSASVSEHARSYAKTIAELSATRQLIRINEEIAAKCYSGKTVLSDVLEESEKKIFELAQSRSTSEITSIKDIVSNTMQQIETAARTKGGVTGVATGFTDLDQKTMGMQPSDLILVAARPSMGKTAFVLNIAEYAAVRQGKKVAIFSLEMPKEQLVKRILSMNSKVDSQKLRSGDLSKSDWHSIVDSAGEISMSGLFIDDTSGISPAQLRSKARKLKLEHDIDMIMIDYLQLMSASGGRNESRQQEISEISRSLKEIARELNVPVIALSQLSRGVESRTDKHPMLSDLRESGAIEQDADVVMFIYRDDYYNKDSDKKGISEITIAKQRNGPIGSVELAWIPELTKFANLDHSFKRDE